MCLCKEDRVNLAKFVSEVVAVDDPTLKFNLTENLKETWKINDDQVRVLFNFLTADSDDEQGEDSPECELEAALERVIDEAEKVDGDGEEVDVVIDEAETVDGDGAFGEDQARN